VATKSLSVAFGAKGHSFGAKIDLKDRFPTGFAQFPATNDCKW
jgi:hypothetical protein